MDLNETRIFTKVVDAQSFVGAARSLGVPKSTVSRKIARLESRSGVPLLQRTTRRLRMTEIGRSYYDRCARGSWPSKRPSTRSARCRRPRAGSLRVSAPVEFGIAFLGGILPEFLARFPDVNVEVDLSSRLVDLGSCPGAWCKSVALYAAPGG